MSTVVYKRAPVQDIPACVSINEGRLAGQKGHGSQLGLLFRGGIFGCIVTIPIPTLLTMGSYVQRGNLFKVLSMRAYAVKKVNKIKVSDYSACQ